MSELERDRQDEREVDSGRRLSRRAVLQQVTAMLGGVAITGSAGMLTAMLPGEAEARMALAMEAGFTEPDIAWLDEVADTLLPETETPGAKAAATGAFIALMVQDTYTEGEQAQFRDGIRQLEDYAAAEHGAGFMDLSPEARLAVLEHFDAEQHAYMENKSDDDPKHGFRMFKELCLMGYFTSEIGTTVARRWQETPGRFDPCVTRDPDDRSWANAM